MVTGLNAFDEGGESQWTISALANYIHPVLELENFFDRNTEHIMAMDEEKRMLFLDRMEEFFVQNVDNISLMSPESREAFFNDLTLNPDVDVNLYVDEIYFQLTDAHPDMAFVNIQEGAGRFGGDYSHNMDGIASLVDRMRERYSSEDPYRSSNLSADARMAHLEENLGKVDAPPATANEVKPPENTFAQGPAGPTFNMGKFV